MYQIVSQDITTVKGSAILNSLGGGDHLINVPGAVFEAIQKKADRRLVDEIGQMGNRLPIGSSFVTGPHGLPCDGIVHLITPYARDEKGKEPINLISALMKAFEAAKEAGFDSIVVPLVGTGANGYSESQSSRACRNACYQFSREHPDFDVFLDIYFPERKVDPRRMEVRSRRWESGWVEEPTLFRARGVPASHRFIHGPSKQQHGEFAGEYPDGFEGMDSLHIGVGDSIGKVLDEYFKAKDDVVTKAGLLDAWNNLTHQIGDCKMSEYKTRKEKDPSAVVPEEGGKDNICFRWHKHADAKAGKKKTPGIAWGEEDPNGIWQRPEKATLIMVAGALDIDSEDAEWLFTFCGYGLSEYSIEDIGYRACIDELDECGKKGDEILRMFRAYNKATGKNLLDGLPAKRKSRKKKTLNENA